MTGAHLTSYGAVAAVLVLGVLLAATMLGANRLLRPSRPTAEKVLTYESGVDPVGSGWAQSHVRYFVFAYLYVIFAVDAVFLFPWATVYARIGWAAAAEMGAFLGFIALGLVHAWRRGVLTWT